jgi:hypothetical protein
MDNFIREEKLEIKLVELNETRKSVFRQLIELYEYDFLEYSRADINEHGYLGYRNFGYHWTEDFRHPFFSKVDDKLVDFLLIGDYARNISSYSCSWDLR